MCRLERVVYFDFIMLVRAVSEARRCALRSGIERIAVVVLMSPQRWDKKLRQPPIPFCFSSTPRWGTWCELWGRFLLFAHLHHLLLLRLTATQLAFSYLRVLIGAGCATGGNFLGDKEGVEPSITTKLRYKKDARKIERKMQLLFAASKS